MTITLELTSEEELRLQGQAAKQGLGADEYILKTIRNSLPPRSSADKVAALRSLLDDDEDEQKETGEYLLRVLDEDRLSYRKLFT